ncbi:hypothetical protein K469DRAFT_687621 [Zopfia rhizophila CBS 207.26]|uniref:Uncharacterized protein n=1 Tax=Zopfia rhizophila CBS 207.26 TaxID=1314779 RepID=A0A6A6E6G3_9PEZI|nr:hypothetical protein K469DRAFT_687621 [Zopfia rhizophila CBS 207.26]
MSPQGKAMLTLCGVNQHRSTDSNKCQGGIPGICRDGDDFTAYLRRQSNANVNVADLRTRWRRAISDHTSGDSPLTDPPVARVSSGPMSSILANVGSPSNTHTKPADGSGHANSNHNPNQSSGGDRSHIGAWCRDGERDETHNGGENMTRNSDSGTQHGEDSGQEKN